MKIQKQKNSLGLLLGVLVISFLFSSLLFSGCGKKKAVEEKEDLPKANITLKQVDQRKKLEKRVSDGQFVILTLYIENPTNKQVMIPAKEILLETTTTNEDDFYTLSPEKTLGQAFKRVYGGVKGPRLITDKDIYLNPKMTATRFLIFTLPNAATLGEFQLHIKSQDLKLPLNSQSVVLNDYRQEDSRQGQYAGQ
ncbi:MAG: hypothetical protein VKJ04_08590 [Vampirovibrionales bacterium]|nr:hypothetical protein [Vampirovibrionales bacterium]